MTVAHSFSFLGSQTITNILLIPQIDQVVSTLMTYASCNDGIHTLSRKEMLPTQVIPYATTSAPRLLLNDNQAYAVQQVCGSIAGLERYTRSWEGQNKLSEFLDPTLVKAMVEFWQNEWIV